MKFLLISKKLFIQGISYKLPVINYFAETINFSPQRLHLAEIHCHPALASHFIAAKKRKSVKAVTANFGCDAASATPAVWTSSEATRDNKLSSYENGEQAESEPDQYKDRKRSV